MALITESKLAAAIERGMEPKTALEYLARERNNLCIVTMGTVGAGSVALNNTEADARLKLDMLEQHAAVNVPMLERLMTAQGWSIETYACHSCGQHRASRTCSNCYEPQEY